MDYDNKLLFNLSNTLLRNVFIYLLIYNTRYWIMKNNSKDIYRNKMN